MGNQGKSELLNIQEASKLLNIKPITLRKWDREGKIEAIRIGTRGDRRFKKSDLMELLEHGSELKNNWQEYIRSGITYFHYLPIAKAVLGGIKTHFGDCLNSLMFYEENNVVFWYYDLDELKKLGHIIVENLLSSKEREEQFFLLWKKKSNEILRFINIHEKSNLPRYDNKDLVEIINIFNELHIEWYNITIAIDATDETMIGDISAILKEELVNVSKKEFIYVLNALTQVSQLSYLSQYRKDILQLSVELKKGKMKKYDRIFRKRLNEILERYWWIELGWFRAPILTVDKLMNEIDSLVLNFKKTQNELVELENKLNEVISKKKKIIRKYKLGNNSDLMELLRLNEKLVNFHDYRKEVQMKINHWQYFLFDEVAKRTLVPSKLLYFSEPENLIKLLQGKKIDIDELNQRSSKFFFLRAKGKKILLSGRAASIKFAEFIRSEKEGVKDFQGMSARDGRVIAKAFVALTPQEAEKISEGEVLVTGMTTPDFLPAIKKSSAIVTDEGGITCHAAIISRELGKPCIVGTKQATRFIKTGDLILVAANHGVVTLL